MPPFIAALLAALCHALHADMLTTRHDAAMLIYFSPPCRALPAADDKGRRGVTGHKRGVGLEGKRVSALARCGAMPET